MSNTNMFQFARLHETAFPTTVFFNPLFQDSFPISLLNKGKIHVDYSYIDDNNTDMPSSKNPKVCTTSMIDDEDAFVKQIIDEVVSQLDQELALSVQPNQDDVATFVVTSNLHNKSETSSDSESSDEDIEDVADRVYGDLMKEIEAYYAKQQFNRRERFNPHNLDLEIDKLIEDYTPKRLYNVHKRSHYDMFIDDIINNVTHPIEELSREFTDYIKTFDEEYAKRMHEEKHKKEELNQAKIIEAIAQADAEVARKEAAIVEAEADAIIHAKTLAKEVAREAAEKVARKEAARVEARVKEEEEIAKAAAESAAHDALIAEADKNIKTSLASLCSENPVSLTDDGEVDTDISVSGYNFNLIYKNVPLVKLTNDEGIHNGMMFGAGVNVDHNTFKYDRSCGPDGIYFCRLADAHHWFDYASTPMVYMWDVTVPDTAKTVIYSSKLKADTVILSNKRRIEDYVTNKLVNMIFTGESISAITSFIKSLPKHLKSSPQMQDVYLTLLVRDLEFYHHIPEEDRTYNVCLYVALHDPNGYDKIKNDLISYELAMECVKTNPSTYNKIPLNERSREMSEYVFSKDVKFYESLPQNHITLEMTKKYLAECETGNVSFVPKCFMNTPDIYTTVLLLDGDRLQDVDFKYQTRDVCMLAVKCNGTSIKHVPLSVMDHDMCVTAVTNTHAAYFYIPEVFKTTEVNEQMVSSHPPSIKWLPPSVYTHNMMLACIKDDELVKNYIGIHTFSNQYVIDLFRRNMSSYYALRKDIYKFIGASCFDETIAYEIVKDDPSAYQKFKGRSLEFTTECVKVGAHFDNVPQDKVTLGMLADLVIARQSIINELPKKFLSDDVYIICMKMHGMKLSEVPTAYYTDKLVKIGMNLYSDDCKIDVDDVSSDSVNVYSFALAPAQYSPGSSPKQSPLNRSISTGELDVSDIMC